MHVESVSLLPALYRGNAEDAREHEGQVFDGAEFSLGSKCEVGRPPFPEMTSVTQLGGIRESSVRIGQPPGILPFSAHPTMNMPLRHQSWGGRDKSEAFCTHLRLQETSAAAWAAQGR